MTQDNSFEQHLPNTRKIATDLLMLAIESGSNIKVIFKDPEEVDGETPIGVVLAVTGSAEHLEALLDVIDLVNANHNVTNSARFELGTDHAQEN